MAENQVVSIDAVSVLKVVLKNPLVRIDRSQYLRKELRKNHPESVVNTAIRENPASAGISRDQINELANQAIGYETNKAAMASFGVGLPYRLVMAVGVSADLIQYYTLILRIMQKLAYLYGFPDFKLNEDEIDDETMNQIIIFLGVMFGVEMANACLKVIARAAAQKISKTLARKALTKGIIYPVVKKVAAAVGIKMTRQIFADNVGKAVPVFCAGINAGLTYFTFKPCCQRLQKNFQSLSLSDPACYIDFH